MRINRCVLIAALSISFWLAGVSLAGPRFALPGFSSGGKGPSAEKFVERIAQELGLTLQQKEKLLAEAKLTEEKAAKVRARDKEIFVKIESELSKEDPNKELIHNYIKEIGQNRTSMQIERMDQIIALRKALTPEQRTKLERLIDLPPFSGHYELEHSNTLTG